MTVSVLRVKRIAAYKPDILLRDFHQRSAGGEADAPSAAEVCYVGRLPRSSFATVSRSAFLIVY
jgi:hypothetical protein